MSDSTVIDRDRIDAFKRDLLALCEQYVIGMVRFRAREDHGRDMPEIEVEFVQLVKRENP